MIKIEVAERERIEVTWLGEGGRPHFILTGDSIHFISQDQTLQHYTAKADSLMKEVEELKQESQQWRDTSYKRTEQIKDLQEQLREAKKQATVTVIYPRPEEIAALIKEHIGRRLMPEWQPLKTAPRDGTRVLLLTEPRYDDGKREQHVGEWARDIGVWFQAAGDKQIVVTHWMPLPEPLK